MENPRTTVNKSRKILEYISSDLKTFIKRCFDEATKINKGRYESQNAGEYLPADNISLNQIFQEQLKHNIQDSGLSEKDVQIVKLFISGLSDLHNQRYSLNLMKSFLVNFTDFIRWINIWYAEINKGSSFSVSTIADVKSMTSSWTKYLLKSAEQIINNSLVKSPPHIRDFFRCTCITCNTKQDLITFTNLVISIITDPNSAESELFQNWIAESKISYGGQKIPKEQLSLLKEFKFYISDQKDFITNPKGAYEALQITVNIKNSLDPALKGMDFELRFMTWEMYVNSKQGEASQSDYKKEIYEFSAEIFDLTNYIQEFFKAGLDLDGLNEHDQFYSRRSSGNTIQSI